MGTRKSAVSRFRTKWQYVASGVMLFAIAVLANCGLSSSPAFAAQTVPYKINYQGRLTNSSGTAMPDGSYNMTFRLYSAASGGTATWTEVRDTTNRVTVTGGQFAVQLGSVTALSPSIFTSQPLYLEVELPSVATATCSTAACASYTEGPMTPRQNLASSAYAMNADTIDGIDSSSLARIDASNTFSSANTFSAANTFNSTVMIGSGNSSSKFVINDNSSVALFTADTVSTIVKVGTTSSATLSNVRLLTTSAEFNGTVRIGTATDGADISAANGVLLSGTARRTRSIVLTPEYANSVLDASPGYSNIGSMTSKFDLTNRRNYYKWTTTGTATGQYYDVVVQVPIPSDFSAWASTTPITVDNYSNDGSFVMVEVRDTSGAVESAINFASIGPYGYNSWQTQTLGAVAGSYTPGGYMTLRLRMRAASSTSDLRISTIKMNYLSKW